MSFEPNYDLRGATLAEVLTEKCGFCEATTTDEWPHCETCRTPICPDHETKHGAKTGFSHCPKCEDKMRAALVSAGFAISAVNLQMRVRSITADEAAQQLTDIARKLGDWDL